MIIIPERLKVLIYKFLQLESLAGRVLSIEIVQKKCFALQLHEIIPSLKYSQSSKLSHSNLDRSLHRALLVLVASAVLAF